MNFQDYNPEQGSLLPPHVRDVLGKDHLVFLVHEVVERQNLQWFVEDYGEEGQRAYHPAMMLKVLLYAYALGLRSVRKIEQRVKEDLGFRYLAGGAEPDYVSFNRFRKRHQTAMTLLFTSVLEQLRQAGMARVGKVAIDSTRIKANASGDRLGNAQQLRKERARLLRQTRRWQRELGEDDPDQCPGQAVAEIERVRQRLRQIPAELQELKKSGERTVSKTDPDSRLLRRRGGFVWGYSTEVAVSEDHFIVAQRVTQNKNDNHSLVPMVDEVERQCKERPQKVLADSGFYSNQNVDEMERRGIDAYLPYSHLASELKGKPRRKAEGFFSVYHRGQRRMRAKLRSPAGRRQYQQRKNLVEPIFGILKEQSGLRQFHTRGLASVNAEFALMAIAFNLKRMFRKRQQASDSCSR